MEKKDKRFEIRLPAELLEKLRALPNASQWLREVITRELEKKQ